MLRSKVIAVGVALLAPLAVGCGKKNKVDPTVSQITWQPYNGKKLRIVVADFTNKSPYSGSGNSFGEVAARMLASSLTQSGHFEVYENASVKPILEQQAFQNTGLVDAASAVKIGSMTGAQIMVLGTITQLGSSQDSFQFGDIGSSTVKFNATIDVSLIDLTSGQSLLADTQTGEYINKSFKFARIGSQKSADEGLMLTGAIRAAIDKLAVALVDKTPTSGYDFQIANVDDSGKVYINAGSGDVTSGQQLKVYRRGKEIKDPSTGAHLDWEESEVGLIEVVEIKAKVATCRILKGRAFFAGDVVRP